MDKKEVGKTVLKEGLSLVADTGIGLFISNLASLTIPFVSGGKFAFIPVAIGASITGAVLGDMAHKKVRQDVDDFFGTVEMDTVEHIEYPGL